MSGQGDSLKNFMEMALEQAEMAAEIGEVPVGAVVVIDDVIISSAYNLREKTQSADAHAELLAIRLACEKMNSWRLPEADLYVTLEPCPMCMGIAINARIRRIFFGAYDAKAGACGSVVNLNDYHFNHKPEIIGGIMEKESSFLLTKFFKKLRL